MDTARPHCLILVKSPRRGDKLRRLSLGVVIAIVTFFPGWAAAAKPGQPVVAKEEMHLVGDDQNEERIEKGDLLTVVEDRGDDYVVVTHQGIRGAVAKANVAELADSTSIYTDLIQRYPEQGRYDTLRGSAWWARGDKDKALADFSNAIDKGYRSAQAYTSRGVFFAAQGDHEAARADYDQALEIDPNDVASRVNRAEAEMQQGEYDEAIVDYTAALKIRQDNAALLRQRAIAYKAAGQLDRAIEDLDAILAKDANDVEALMDRGYIRFQRQNYAAAVTDFSIAIELNDKDPVAWNNRGYNRYQLGQTAEALQDYDHAIELAPKYALAHQNRAWLLATTSDSLLRDPEAAIVAAKKACDINSYEDVSDLSALAAAYAAAGQFRDAVDWQEKVVELAPADVKPVAKKLLGRYRDQKPYVTQDAEDDP